MKRLTQSLLATAAVGLLYAGPALAKPHDPLLNLHAHNGAFDRTSQSSNGKPAAAVGRHPERRPGMIHAQTQHQQAAMDNLSADRIEAGQDLARSKSKSGEANANHVTRAIPAASAIRGASSGSDAADNKGVSGDCAKLKTCKSSAPRIHMNASQAQQLTGAGEKPVDAASQSGSRDATAHGQVAKTRHRSSAPRMHLNAAQAQQLSGASEMRVDAVHSGFSSRMQSRLSAMPGATFHAHVTRIRLPSQFYR